MEIAEDAERICKMSSNEQCQELSCTSDYADCWVCNTVNWWQSFSEEGQASLLWINQVEMSCKGRRNNLLLKATFHKVSVSVWCIQLCSEFWWRVLAGLWASLLQRFLFYICCNAYCETRGERSMNIVAVLRVWSKTLM